MQLKHKKRSNFIIIKELKSSAGNDFTNPVYVVRKRDTRFDAEQNPKPKYQYDWFMKNEKDERQAQREVIAQEFFRLIYPVQPKTRYVKGNDIESRFVLSKGINGFEPVASMSKEEFKSGLKTGKLHGLGELLAISLVTNEVDLHLNNIGTDKLGNLIKIDGGCCFEKLKGKKVTNYSITEKDIAQLPYVTTYAPVNWLDLVKRSKSEPSSELFSAELSVNPLFRNEINSAMLKMLVLPDQLIHAFVGSYAESKMDISIISNEIISRKNDLRKAALENESFQKFLQEPATREYLNNYIEQLKQFKSMKKNFLLTQENQDYVVEEIHGHFKQLCNPEQKTTEVMSLDMTAEKLKAQSGLAMAALRKSAGKMVSTLGSIAEVSQPKEIKQKSKSPLPAILEQPKRPEKNRLFAKSKPLALGAISEEAESDPKQEVNNNSAAKKDKTIPGK